MVQSKIIYSNREIHDILQNKAKYGAYYLMYDDIFFEKIEKGKNISRDFYQDAKSLVRSVDIPKHISFEYKENYTTQEMFDLVEDLRKYATMLLMIFDPKEKECNLLFISSNNDFKIEKYINDFVKLEEM